MPATVGLASTMGSPYSRARAASVSAAGVGKALPVRRWDWRESKQMAVGAAGAPGQNAEPVPRKGGDSATTLHPRMEVPHAQGRAHRPGPAEYLWMQPGKTVNCCSKGMQANKDHLLQALIHYFSRMNLMTCSLYQLTCSKAASLFPGIVTPILLRATVLSY